ncbi:MAG: SAM-dependent methyltransferase [Elusimicrobiota bacterium]
MSEAVRLCGLGMRVPEETTLESLIALGECREVFCRVEDPRYYRWLASQGIRLKRPKNAAQIVAAARNAGGPVGLAVWGHPQFNSRFAREAEIALRDAGLPYRVYGSISPVGSAFARSVSFLGGEYGCLGLRCLDLESLLSDASVAATRLPLIVFSEKSPAARWTALFGWLRERYPASHEARVYHCGSDAEVLTPVGKLKAKGFSGAILLVPPSARG